MKVELKKNDMCNEFLIQAGRKLNTIWSHNVPYKVQNRMTKYNSMRSPHLVLKSNNKYNSIWSPRSGLKSNKKVQGSSQNQNIIPFDQRNLGSSRTTSYEGT